MGWLDGTNLIQSDTNQFHLNSRLPVGRLTAKHVTLVWNRLAGESGIPFNSSGQFHTGGWLEVVRTIQPGELVIVGLQEDVAIFGSISNVIAQAKWLCEERLQIPLSSVILSPVPFWSESAPSTDDWSLWVQIGKNAGFTRWLMDVTPYNRLWRASGSRFGQNATASYVSYIQGVSSVLSTYEVERIGIVHWSNQNGWGSSLVNSIAPHCDTIACGGLLPAPTSTIPELSSMFAQPITVALGIKQAADASGKVKMVLPVAPLISDNPSSDDPTRVSVNVKGPGVAIRHALLTYLSEMEQIQSVGWWLQPYPQQIGNVESTGVALCNPDGTGITRAGIYLEEVRRAAGGQVPSVSGQCERLGAQDLSGQQREAPATPSVISQSPDIVRLMVVSPGNTERNVHYLLEQGGWVSTFCGAWNLSDTTEPAFHSFALRRGNFHPIDPPMVSGDAISTRIQGWHLVFIHLKMASTPPIWLGAQGAPPIQQPNVEDGIGDMLDLHPMLLVDNSMVDSGVVGRVLVHSGTFFHSGNRHRLFRGHVEQSLSIPGGSPYTATLVESPVGSQKPVLYDNAGEFRLVYGWVRCLQPISAQVIDQNESPARWRYQVPGRVIAMFDPDTGRHLFRQPSSLDLAEDGYALEDSGRTVIARKGNLLVDYVSPTPGLWMEEYVWSDDSHTLASRHEPYLQSASAMLLDTGNERRIFIPSSADGGVWRFNQEIPIGRYLVRYLVDRSFTVWEKRVSVFSSLPTVAKIVYSCGDDGYLDIHDLGSTPEEPVRIESTVPQPLLIEMAEDDSVMPTLSGTRVRAFPLEFVHPDNLLRVLVSVQDEYHRPVAGATITATLISGMTVLTQQPWISNSRGELVLEMVPSTGSARIVLSVSGTGASCAFGFLHQGTAPLSLRAFTVDATRIPGNSDDYDLCAISVLPVEPLKWTLDVTVTARSGWVSPADTALSRQQSTSFQLPPQSITGVIRIARHPLSLDIQVRAQESGISLSFHGVDVP